MGIRTVVLALVLFTKISSGQGIRKAGCRWPGGGSKGSKTNLPHVACVAKLKARVRRGNTWSSKSEVLAKHSHARQVPVLLPARMAVVMCPVDSWAKDLYSS